MILRIIAAVASITVINKVLEAKRCRKANASMKMAKLPPGCDEKGVAVVDDVGAEVRGLMLPDGLQLYVRDWVPSPGTEVKGMVVIVHGGGWHSAPHAPLATHLNSMGFVVVAYDMRGHGLSGREDGLNMYSRDFKQHCDDLVAILHTVRARHSGLPYFIFTESVGGAVMMCTLAKHASTPVLQGLSGYVMMAPFVKISDHLKPPALVLLIAKVLAKVFPKMVLPDKKIVETFDDAFPDKATADKWRSDPLVLASEPPMVRPMISLLSYLQASWKGAVAVTTPFMIIGSKIDIRTQIKHAKEFCAESAAADKSVLEYEDGAHQLLQDTPAVTARVMHDLSTWLLNHV